MCNAAVRTLLYLLPNRNKKEPTIGLGRVKSHKLLVKHKWDHDVFHYPVLSPIVVNVSHLPMQSHGVCCQDFECGIIDVIHHLVNSGWSNNLYGYFHHVTKFLYLNESQFTAGYLNLLHFSLLNKANLQL